MIERLKNKNDVVRQEYNNFSLIILYATGNDFWCATMNSALFMKNILGSSAKMHVMEDYFFKTNRIYVSYNKCQMEAIKTKAEKLKYTILRNDAQFFVFALPEQVRPEQIREWNKAGEVKKEKIEGYYRPSTVAATTRSVPGSQKRQTEDGRRA